MPLPPITVISSTVKSLGLNITNAYNNIQTSGATDDGAVVPLNDNLIASNVRSQQFGQAKTPLFTPFDKYDPQLSDANRAENQITDEGAVYKQLGNNGIMPIFFSVLNGIANYFTSSKWVVGTRAKYGVVFNPVATSTQYFLLSDPGNLPHSTKHESSPPLPYPTDPASFAGETGVPIDTGATDAARSATYVELIDATTGSPLTDLAGTSRLFGRSSGASPAVAGNSVKIDLYTRPLWGDPAAAATAYTWETGMPSTVTLNVIYGFRQTLAELDDVAFRRVFR